MGVCLLGFMDSGWLSRFARLIHLHISTVENSGFDLFVDWSQPEGGQCQEPAERVTQAPPHGALALRAASRQSVSAPARGLGCRGRCTPCRVR